MMGWKNIVFIAVACVSAGWVGWCVACIGAEYRRANRQRRSARRSAGVDRGQERASSVAETVVRYCTVLSKQLASGAARPLFFRRDFAGHGRRKESSFSQEKSRSNTWVSSHALKAGIAAELSVAGFREARLRLSLGCAAVGGLVGALLSNELAVLMGAMGLLLGASAPRWAMQAREKDRTNEIEQHLSEMLEVVALGLRSGLSFDRSFELYAVHCPTSLARACSSAQRRWLMGLTTREEALRDLAAAYNSEQLVRVVESVVRSLRFGSSLAEGLEAAAIEARAEHRARVEEKVAKAPVKMMMPTGALILPAMLLLVLGPVLLELAEGF